MWAVDAENGQVRWSTDTTKLPPGGKGGFYSSPSIAFGHVYEARDDGTVYALDQGSGKLDWHFVTSNSIYASPAAAHVPGTPPSVYVGSYDHQLYALDAESGEKRWRYERRRGDPRHADRGRQDRLHARAFRPRRRSASTRRPASRSSTGARPGSPR